FWLVKTDSTGTKMWDKTFDRTDCDYAKSVQQTSDGGYIIAGSAEYYVGHSVDFWLVKTDSTGTKMWDKTFDRTDCDYAKSVQQTSDGGYIIAGSTGYYDYDDFKPGDFDFWLVKTDSAGTEMWDKTFGGTDLDYARSVQQTSDGGYIIAGSTGSYWADSYDFWLVKVKGVQIVCGDTDGSGFVNSTDLHLLLDHVFTDSLITNECAGDVDGSGNINILDVRLLMNYLFNPTEYPLNCTCLMEG
ncbi:MAG: dockerin type I repeat-containing protein, partial [Methanosarcinales archaeon]|nr:dockerin type I repeat-containing protein [Methanosarcinales archaeon]